jgi:hypothetical protein
MITTALLVGPALGCGGPEPEPNTIAPEEITSTETTEVPNTNSEPPFDEEPPTGNPGVPEPEPEPEPEPPQPETNVGRSTE